MEDIGCKSEHCWSRGYHQVHFEMMDKHFAIVDLRLFTIGWTLEVLVKTMDEMEILSNSEYWNHCWNPRNELVYG